MGMKLPMGSSWFGIGVGGGIFRVGGLRGFGYWLGISFSHFFKLGNVCECLVLFDKRGNKE